MGEWTDKTIAEITFDNPDFELDLLRNGYNEILSENGFAVIEVHKIIIKLNENGHIGVFLYRNNELLAKDFLFKYDGEKVIISRTYVDEEPYPYYKVKKIYKNS
jgi:hypothetical protein